MSYRKETATRNYYAWVGHPTKASAEKEAREYKKEGKKYSIAYDKKHKCWLVWRWNSKK
jgi:hypothetical protein